LKVEINVSESNRKREDWFCPPSGEKSRGLFWGRKVAMRGKRHG